MGQFFPKHPTKSHLETEEQEGKKKTADLEKES
jgi:hypothetical protein